MDLPKRKPTRLREFDYSKQGAYFITICTHNRRNILSDVIVGEGLCALPQVRLTPIGELVNNAIIHINENYNGVSVDKYVVMPNHIHLIIKIDIPSGGDGTPPLQLYDIIGRFKSFTTKEYGNILWQRSFHDHIIRNINDYSDIWNYIDLNPQKWDEDSFNTK
ncbi:MAG: hypothetical protein J6B22_06515 [Clostridia bacterium]|nr:hypothetical protein [Clostridia bacterium]